MYKYDAIHEIEKRKEVVYKLYPEYIDTPLFGYSGITKYFAEIIRDNSLVLLVYHYHKDQDKVSIESFLDTKFPIILREYTGLYNFLKEHITFVVEYINQIVIIFSEFILLDIKILGDIHQGKSSKIGLYTSNGDYIVFGNIYDSQKKIRDLIISCDRDLEECFSERESKDQFRYRQQKNIRLLGDMNETIAYYFYFGKIVPYILYFQIADLYYENILCCTPYPYFFDIEVAFGGVEGDYNITTIGLVAQDNSQYAILNGDDAITSYTVPSIYVDNGVYMIKWIVPSQSQKTSVPTIKISRDEKLTNLLRGYEISCHIIKKNLDTIMQHIKNTTFYTRVILRPTREYVMIMRSYQYELINNKDISLYDWAKRMLSVSYITTNLHESNLADIHERECQLLSKGIIPSFYINIHDNILLSSDNSLQINLPYSYYEKRLLYTKDFFLFSEEQKELLYKYL